jgi:hypothetical protein
LLLSGREVDRAALQAIVATQIASALPLSTRGIGVREIALSAWAGSAGAAAGLAASALELAFVAATALATSLSRRPSSERQG